jgi:hypothetical protein
LETKGNALNKSRSLLVDASKNILINIFLPSFWSPNPIRSRYCLLNCHALDNSQTKLIYPLIKIWYYLNMYIPGLIQHRKLCRRWMTCLWPQPLCWTECVRLNTPFHDAHCRLTAWNFFCQLFNVFFRYSDVSKYLTVFGTDHWILITDLT